MDGWAQCGFSAPGNCPLLNHNPRRAVVEQAVACPVTAECSQVGAARAVLDHAVGVELRHPDIPVGVDRDAIRHSRDGKLRQVRAGAGKLLNSLVRAVIHPDIAGAINRQRLGLEELAVAISVTTKLGFVGAAAAAARC